MLNPADPSSLFADPVRNATSPRVNARIDAQFSRNVRHYQKAGPGAISRRLDELDREWDIERVLEVNAAGVVLTGLVLGITQSRKWLLVPAVAMGFLLQHALQGWCPPVSLFRRYGFRTQREIDREKYALKTIRGDFKHHDESAH